MSLQLTQRTQRTQAQAQTAFIADLREAAQGCTEPASTYPQQLGPLPRPPGSWVKPYNSYSLPCVIWQPPALWVR